MADDTTTTDTTTAAATETAGNTEQAQPKWHEDARFEPYRATLTAKGLTALDDPLEAIGRLADMQVNADKKLGRPADQLIARPAKDQDTAAWMREHRDLFGIPEAPEGYEVKPPDAWPKDAQWDKALETEARKIAHEEGLSGRGLQRMTDAYAGAVQRLMTGADAEIAAAKAVMMTELQTTWGKDTDARVARAQNAASVMAEHLGLDSDGLAALAGSLKPVTGDAGLIRLFDAIGDMLGSDRAESIGKGGGALGMTAEAASARLAELRKPGAGEYAKAVAENDRATLRRLQPEIDRLSRIAAGG